MCGQNSSAIWQQHHTCPFGHELQLTQISRIEVRHPARGPPPDRSSGAPSAHGPGRGCSTTPPAKPPRCQIKLVITSRKMSSDFPKTVKLSLAPNGPTMSPRRQKTAEWARTRWGENLHVSLTRRRGRVRGPLIDLRGGRIEVVGTRAGRNLLLCIQDLCLLSPWRPQIRESVYVAPGSRSGVNDRRGRALWAGRQRRPPFLRLQS